MNFKNLFGSATKSDGLDLQRVDLWKVTLTLPDAVKIKWTDEVEFALEKFPFPERSREMIAVKYMQQTNHVIGGDTPTPQIEVPVRYAFSAQTAEALEKWFWLVSNPRTGSVGLTTELKSNGYMRWMVPSKNVSPFEGSGAESVSSASTANILTDGLTYVLEGVIIKGLKYGDADMTQSGIVNLMLTLQIDRWYAEDVNNMKYPFKKKS